jgi:hypothetical protein
VAEEVEAGVAAEEEEDGDEKAEEEKAGDEDGGEDVKVGRELGRGGAARRSGGSLDFIPEEEVG